MDFYHDYLPKLENPLNLSKNLPQVIANDSSYMAVFFPNGYGVLVNIPKSEEVKDILNWAMK